MRITSLLFSLLALVVFTSGCATSQIEKSGKIVLTPLTVVRDVVDAPVVSIANSFEYFAEQSSLAKAPSASGGYSIKGGFNAGIGYDFSYILFKGMSFVFGGVDYVVCRSIWPNYPKGITPWSRKGHHWGDLYFPNTRVLWGDNRPLQRDTHSHGSSKVDPTNSGIN